MKKFGRVLFATAVLVAVQIPVPQSVKAQDAIPDEKAQPVAMPADPARLCANSTRIRPVWWGDGVVIANLGCATSHNASLQNVPTKPAAPSGTDGVTAVSGVLRHRTGTVQPLRSPAIQVGAEE